MALPNKKYGDLCLSQTVVFVCDIQERFRKAISFFPEISEVANRLVSLEEVLNKLYYSCQFNVLVP